MKNYLKIMPLAFLLVVLMAVSCEKENDPEISTAFDGSYSIFFFNGSSVVAASNFIITAGKISGTIGNSGEPGSAQISGNININSLGEFSGSFDQTDDDVTVTLKGTISEGTISGTWIRDKGDGTFSGFEK